MNAPLLHPRRRALHASGGFEWALTWYPPGLSMAAHTHDVDQNSLLLAGSLEEETPSRKAVLTAGAAEFKAAGLSHANVYGSHGALILSLNRPREDGSGAPWRWRHADQAAARQLAALALEGGIAARDALADDAALIHEGDGDAAVGPPPPWLIRVRAAVDADPARARADALAAEAGVHRVHLRRRFAAAYGAPFSLYRRRAMVTRAVRGLVQDGMAASVAASDAGFADQAHLGRALKAQTGFTPGRLNALLPSE